MRTLIARRTNVVCGSRSSDSRFTPLSKSRISAGLPSDERFRSLYGNSVRPRRFRTRRGEDTSSFQPSATPALILPRLPQLALDVPRRVVIEVDTGHIAEFVHHALELGLLTDDDWTGDLVLSTEKALCRNLSEAAHTLGVLDNLDVVFDLEAMLKLDVKGAVEFRMRRGWNEFYLEGPVMALEEIESCAGFAVVICLERALHSTVGGGTIGWCESQIDWLDEHSDEYDDDPDVEERPENTVVGMSGTFLPGVEVFASLAPTAKIVNTIDTKALLAVKNAAPSSALRELMELCLNFAALKAPKIFNSVMDIHDEYPALPIALRWNTNDRMNEVIDDYHDFISQTGISDTLLSIALNFGATDMESDDTKNAAEQVRYTFQALTFVDRALRLLCPDQIAEWTTEPVRMQVRA